jgi:hypothetical protein
MKYRLKALGWHFFASTALLVVIIGGLYLGWYRWPGWYLAGLLKVIPITVGVDAALGPLLTFIVASPTKPLRILARDIAFIAVVQLVALVYGSLTLWHGRPLYYAFSVNELSVIQATDLDSKEIALGQQLNPNLAPHWYSLPSWIYAPLPADSKTSDAIVQSAIFGGNDGTDMPRYFQPWKNGLPELRKTLQKVADCKFFSVAQRKLLAQRMTERGFPADAAITLPMTGRDVPLLAVFDPQTLEIKAMLSAKP